jgi:hypothetical protein
MGSFGCGTQARVTGWRSQLGRRSRGERCRARTGNRVAARRRSAADRVCGNAGSNWVMPLNARNGGAGWPIQIGRGERRSAPGRDHHGAAARQSM